MAPNCDHKRLCVTSSSHAAVAGYVQPDPTQRAKATTTSTKPRVKDEPWAFPAPLILPDDDLAYYPSYPAQSFRSWVKGKWRNEVTTERKTLYVIDVPAYDARLEFAEEWTKPTQIRGKKSKQQEAVTIQPIVDYVAAFYTGLPVKLLSSKTLRLTPWDENPSALKLLKSGESSETVLIGLETGKERIGIRTRPPPHGAFERQLNLNDVLDAVIRIVPEDAYAIVLVTNHDLYEDEEDDFCCGRAYGGSRVAVVSTTRYNPILDKNDPRPDLQHAWPNAHCEAYIRSLISEPKKKKRKLKDESSNENEPLDQSGPLVAASDAAKAYQKTKTQSMADLWMSRICRTTSHELGHCFGMDHCVYYACCMQGTASILEDYRQPPYLCPVDLAKVLKATGSSEEQHYRAMLEFCEKYSDTELFAAYAAWLQARLLSLGVERQH